MEFGKNLKQMRKKRGWKKVELAEKCGVSKDTIAAWEKGEAEPTATELIALSKTFNKTVDELIQNTEMIDEKRENYFRIVCRFLGFVVDGLWSAEDAKTPVWDRIFTDNKVLELVYDIAGDRFISSNGKVYEKYLVENSSKEDRYDWVKFINCDDPLSGNEGLFKEYIDGECEISKSYRELSERLNTRSKKFSKQLEEKFKSNVYKNYEIMKESVQILKEHSTYSEKKIAETIDNLDRIISEQDEATILGRFFTFKCQEIKRIFAEADDAKMAELEDDLIFHQDYIWNKIIVEDEPAEVVPD